MAGARFKFLLSDWKQRCVETDDPDFPVIQKSQIPTWCERSKYAASVGLRNLSQPSLPDRTLVGERPPEWREAY